MFKGGNEMSSEKRFLYRQRFGYGMGDFACNLIWQVISLYLLYFYTDVMKLNAAAIATMFVVCRVINEKWGRSFCVCPHFHIHMGTDTKGPSLVVFKIFTCQKCYSSIPY
jgi:hypothetical protein